MEGEGASRLADDGDTEISRVPGVFSRSPTGFADGFGVLVEGQDRLLRWLYEPWLGPLMPASNQGLFEEHVWRWREAESSVRGFLSCRSHSHIHADIPRGPADVGGC